MFDFDDLERALSEDEARIKGPGTCLLNIGAQLTCESCVAECAAPGLC